MIRLKIKGIPVECETADEAIAIIQRMGGSSVDSAGGEVVTDAPVPIAKPETRRRVSHDKRALVIEFARQLLLVQEVLTVTLFNQLGVNGPRGFSMLENAVIGACEKLGFDEDAVFVRGRDGARRLFRPGPRLAEFLAEAEKRLIMD